MAEELLVFGYSCKLFHDDEKALHIEKGKHLIPWMNDSNLLIDRFDVRGALYSLKEAEPSGKTLEESLTPGELKEEEVCDHERYLALYHDEEQEQLYKEEETKRIQVELESGDTYKQMGFDYNQVGENRDHMNNTPDDPGGTNSHPGSYCPTEDEDFFIPPPELALPMGMDVPTSKKQHKVIVKTAQFVVSQGAQMEILIKTKQNGNPMFNFLAFDNPLNAYYKHVANMIRKGRYRPDEEPVDKNEQNGQASLNLGVRPDITPSVMSPSRSSQCSYSSLITKIREKQRSTAVEEGSDTQSPKVPSSPVHNPDDGTEPVVAQLPIDLNLNTMPSPIFSLIPPPPPPAPLGVVECLTAEMNAPQVPISTNGLPTIVNSTPLSAQPKLPARMVGLVDYPSFNMTADGNSSDESEEHHKSPAVSESGKSGVHDYSHIKWPPPELQLVIDKMASYIIKNGDGFEQLVKNKDDPRFKFLHPTNEFHDYYQCKMQLYNEVYGDFFKNLKQLATSSSPSKHRLLKPTTEPSSPVKLVSAPTIPSHNGRTISFSIKSRDAELPLKFHSTFPIETSSSEDNDDLTEEEKEKKRVEREKRRLKRRERAKEEKRVKEREEKLRKEDEVRLKKIEDDESSGNEDLYDIFKYAQEMTHNSPASAKKSEANEDDLSTISPKTEFEPETVKQTERKRKAAAFLSKLKDEDPVFGPQLPPEKTAPFVSPASKKSQYNSSEDDRDAKSSKRKSCVGEDIELLSGDDAVVRESKRCSLTMGLVETLQAASAGEKVVSSPDTAFSPAAINSRSASLDTESTSIASVLAKGLKSKREVRNSSRQSKTESHKSRSHKKHSKHRSRSESRSRTPGKKHRKRSRSRKRKKHRSRSRDRKRRKTSHQKKRKSHHHAKDSKKKKKKRAKSPSPSSTSSSDDDESSEESLPSSDDSSENSEEALNSDSDKDVDIIEDPSSSSKRVRETSPTSSVVSVALKSDSDIESTHSTSMKNTKKDDELNIISDCEEAIEEDGKSPVASAKLLEMVQNSRALNKPASPLLPLLKADSGGSSIGESVQESVSSALFNPSKSKAMSKIAQGLRAKLHALLEKENNFD